MPIEVLENPGSLDQANILSEIISQSQQFILGAKLDSADFEFIAVSDTAGFAAIPEGAFFTDLNPEGLNRVGRKIAGQRKYLAYEQEMRAYVVDEIAKIKPIAVNPSVSPLLPTSTTERPIYAGQEIVFLTSGTVEGLTVEAGGIAVALADIPVGTKIAWPQLQYNGTGIAVTPILLRDSIRLDGSAGGSGATEKAIADAIIAVRNALETNITILSNEARALIANLVGRITLGEVKNAEQDGKLQVLETSNLTITNRLDGHDTKNAQQDNRIGSLETLPRYQEETILVGNGANQVFQLALQYKYLTAPQLIWYMLMGSGFVRINPQDGDVVEIENICYLKAAFAGVPASNQFKVNIQGLVAA